MTYKVCYWDAETKSQQERDATPDEVAEIEARKSAQNVPVVPTSVTMRQACLALENAGILDDVEALVATLPRPYQIEWQRASMVERTNQLVEVVRQQQGMTVQQIDDMFIQAATL